MGMSVISYRKKLDTTKYKEGICRVGFFEGSKYEGGKTVASVARYNEFGLGVPMRPFMRPALHENKARIISELKSEYKQAIKDNANTMDVLSRMGLKIQGLIQAKIISTTEPPNALSTIKRKGFNAPLRDTLVMLGSVQHQEEEIRK